MGIKTRYTVRPESVQYMTVPDGTIVFFRENIKDGGHDPALGCDTYVADEYSVLIHSGPAVAKSRVEANYEAWLAEAKRQAEKDTPPADMDTMLLELAADHEERICMLELGV